MKIIVHLHTTLQRIRGRDLIRRMEVELPPGATLGDLCVQIGAKIDPENTLLVVNHRNVDLDYRLSEHDEAHLIPAISGG